MSSQGELRGLSSDAALSVFCHSSEESDTERLSGSHTFALPGNALGTKPGLWLETPKSFTEY